MTLGEYVDLVKDPKKAALKQAGEKQGKLPGKLGEYGMEYQRK